MPGRQQLSARIENSCGCPVIRRISVAEGHPKEGPRVHGTASFQQREEEVRTKADAGMADYPHLITGKYGALSPMKAPQMRDGCIR